MKKLILICSSLFLLLTFLSSLQPLSIDQKLRPYQEAIDRVNAEFNATITIPKETKNEVYNNIKSMTPQQFESLIRHQCRTTGKGNSRIPKNPSLTYKDYEHSRKFYNSGGLK